MYDLPIEKQRIQPLKNHATQTGSFKPADLNRVDPKRLQNQAEIYHLGVPGGSRGGVWKDLGEPWVVLEILRGILKALGPILGRLGAILEPKMGSKIGPKRLPKGAKIQLMC